MHKSTVVYNMMSLIEVSLLTPCTPYFLTLLSLVCFPPFQETRCKENRRQSGCFSEVFVIEVFGG